MKLLGRLETPWSNRSVEGFTREPFQASAQHLAADNRVFGKPNLMLNQQLGLHNASLPGLQTATATMPPATDVQCGPSRQAGGPYYAGPPQGQPFGYPPGLEQAMQQIGSAFQLLATTSHQQLEITKRGQEAGQARSLKIEHRLPRIGTSDIGKVPFELAKLEKELQIQKINKWETWYSYLMSFLGDEPRRWVESRMTRPPLSDYVSAARAPGAQPSDWERLYQQV